MDIRTSIKLALLQDPTNGEFIATSTLFYFQPSAGQMYSPVLVHVDLEHVMNSTMRVVNDLISSVCPPMVLFTYGPLQVNGTKFSKYMQEMERANQFGSIVSIVNPKLDFHTSFYTLHDNIPVDMSERLSSLFQWGKLTGEGNGVAETIGCMLNKPVISINMLGLDTDYDQLAAIVEEIPRYPDYTYIENIKAEAPPINEGKCACCNRPRFPLKFFNSIRTHLCPVCEARAKRIGKGKINLMSWYAAVLEVKQERVRTHKANMRQQLNEFMCPNCNGIIREGLYRECQCPTCHKSFFRDKNTLYSYSGTSALSPVTKYTYVNGLVTKQTALSFSSSPLEVCEVCMSPAIVLESRIEQDTGYHIPICKRCMTERYRSVQLRLSPTTKK